MIFSKFLTLTILPSNRPVPDELKAADVSDKQARAQSEAMCNAFSAHDAGSMKELATKGDLRDAELRIIKWTIGIIFTQTALLVSYPYF